jgi:hypothetical protein
VNIASDRDDCESARLTVNREDATELERRRARVHQQSCDRCSSEQSVDAMLSTLTTGHSDAAERVHAQLSMKRPRWSVAVVALLGMCSALQAVIALPWLVGANPFRNVLGVASNEHLTRDGALGVMVAVAGFVVAWRPRYAFAMLALVAAATGMQILGGVVDAPESYTHVPFEFIHLLALVIALLIVFVAVRRDDAFGPLRSAK